MQKFKLMSFLGFPPRGAKKNCLFGRNTMESVPFPEKDEAGSSSDAHLMLDAEGGGEDGDDDLDDAGAPGSADGDAGAPSAARLAR